MFEFIKGGAVPAARKGMPSPRLDETEFKRRYREHFDDPLFSPLEADIARITEVAWRTYEDSRKSPKTQKAGPGHADPDYDLSVDWIAARDAVQQAEARQKGDGPRRVLIVNGSSRSEHTCPGEMSKSWRMAEIAQKVFEDHAGFEVELLDLSRIASEYGRNIHPCKACFSTAAALCHWPCSCYPNHSLGQIHDWMNEIYPMWVAAHGIMVITPVNWYQTSSPLKLMIDRLVCADGGNPDPSSTHGKKAEEGKRLELNDWDYPRHLEGRFFSVIVHGDTEGVENVRRGVSDWLKSMKLVPAGPNAEIDRYIGYWKPYATSHDEFDDDKPVQKEVENAARTLLQAILADKAGQFVAAGSALEDVRPK